MPVRFLLTTILVLCSTMLIQALPGDFEQSLVAGNLKDPVSMAFAPDGRLFILERVTGNIRILNSDNSLLPEPFAKLDVPPEAHRSGGLRAMAFDPNFSTNSYLYVFYTKQFSTKRHNRVSRFQADPTNPNIVLAGSETVLMELPFNNHAKGSSGSHNGGAIFFGPDNKLYFTTGDGWNNSNGYGKGDNVQSLSTYTGKLFRINPDGTIPTDNPFYNQTTENYRAIWALGFRNPFSGAMHPESEDIFLFDVGDVWGGNKDYIYKVSAGDNGRHDAASTVSIGSLISPWLKTDSRIISGGDWYYGNAFPPEYTGNLFVSSWGGDDIQRITSITDKSISSFANDGAPDNGPVHVQVGPDGSLYYLITTYSTNTGEIYRISYNGENRVSSPAISPPGGDFIASVETSITAPTENASIRYTLDGSEPDQSSDLYSGPFSISSSSTVKAKSFKDGLHPSSIVSVFFNIEDGVAPEFTSTPPDSIVLGTNLIYTATATGTPNPVFSFNNSPAGATINESTGEVTWTTTAGGIVNFTIQADNGIGEPRRQSFSVHVIAIRPDEEVQTNSAENGLYLTIFDEETELFNDLQSHFPSSIAPTFNLSLAPNDSKPNTVSRFEGYLKVPVTGVYTLYLNANEAARLRIGTKAILESNGFENASVIGLEAGFHIITLELLQLNDPPTLNLEWEGPDTNREPIPDLAWHRLKKQPGIFLRQPSPAYLNFPASENEPLPATLSATGAFSDVSSLTVNSGIMPYDVASPLWSDNATKQRWLSLPTDSQAVYSETDNWIFPPGSVFIKHFELGDEGYRLETRFLIVKSDSSIYGLTYRWRRDHSDADLVGLDGLTEEIRINRGQRQTWSHPSRANCTTCHTPSSGFVLGLRTGQLNKAFTYPNSGVTDNQLHTMIHLNLLAESPNPETLDSKLRFPRLDNDSAPLLDRVKSYLEVNCAMCHNPSNPMEGANFDMRFTTPLQEMRLVETSPSNNLGITGSNLIKPTDPHGSIIYHRISSIDPKNRMPPIGGNMIDTQATSILLEWISELQSSSPITTPETSITSPAQDSIFTENDTINFTLTTSDNENANNPETVHWISNLNGILGEGSSIKFKGLSAGSHTIYCISTFDNNISASTHIELAILPGFLEWAFLRGVPNLDPWSDENANGLEALIEYAFNIEPHSFNFTPSRLSTVVTDQGSHLTLSFPIHKNAKDLVYTLQQSADLVNWSNLVSYNIANETLNRSHENEQPTLSVQLNVEDEGSTWRVLEQIRDSIENTNTKTYLRVEVRR